MYRHCFMKNEDFIKLENTYSLCQQNQQQLVFQKGEGTWLWDVEGVIYFDAATFSHQAILGHSPPRLMSILIDQAKTLSLNTSFLYNDRLGPFLKKLSEMTGYSRCAAFNSSYQALFQTIQYAISRAHKLTESPLNALEVIVLSSVQTYLGIPKELLPHCHFIEENHIEKLKEFQGNVALVLLNPLDWDSDTLLVQESLLKELKLFTQRHQALLVLDESLVPAGYFGKNFAFNLWEKNYFDGVILGEYLGAGMIPVAAACFTEDAFSQTGSLHAAHSSIYPVAAALALEAICMLEEGFLADKSLKRGQLIKSHLSNRKYIKKICGQGLLLKIELTEEITADEILSQMQKLSIFCQKIGPQMILISPPLTVLDTEVDNFILKLNQIFLLNENIKQDQQLTTS